MIHHIRDGTVGIATAASSYSKQEATLTRQRASGECQGAPPCLLGNALHPEGTAIAWFLLSNLWWNEGLNQFCDHRTLSEGQLLCQTPFFSQAGRCHKSHHRKLREKDPTTGRIRYPDQHKPNTPHRRHHEIFKTPGWLQEAIDNVAREREEEEHQQWLQQEAHRLAVEIVRQKRAGTHGQIHRVRAIHGTVQQQAH